MIQVFLRERYLKIHIDSRRQNKDINKKAFKNKKNEKTERMKLVDTKNHQIF